MLLPQPFAKMCAPICFLPFRIFLYRQLEHNFAFYFLFSEFTYRNSCRLWSNYSRKPVRTQKIFRSGEPEPSLIEKLYEMFNAENYVFLLLFSEKLGNELPNIWAHEERINEAGDFCFIFPVFASPLPNHTGKDPVSYRPCEPKLRGNPRTDYFPQLLASATILLSL